MADVLTLINWNLNAFTSDRLIEKLDVLRRNDWDVATLQELLPANVPEIEKAFPSGVLITRPPSRAWPRPGQRRCCGVIVRRSEQFIQEQVIDCNDGVSESGTPNVPAEALVGADVLVGASRVSIISAHPPHSAGVDDVERAWRLRGKLGIYDALNRWLRGREHVIVGMDSNTWLDRSPFEPAAWNNDDEQAAVSRFFFEPDPAHGLHDALREWLRDRSDALGDIRARRPHGPLAVTHVRGGNRPVADRFDVIMISKSFRVEEIEHNYEDAVAAGSDHAYVRATLRLDS